MTGNIHPDYLRLVSSCGTENTARGRVRFSKLSIPIEDKSMYGSPPRESMYFHSVAREAESSPVIQPSQEQEVPSTRALKSQSSVVYFALTFFLGAIITSLSFFSLGAFRRDHSLDFDLEKAFIAENEQMKGELLLVKRILGGVVETLSELSDRSYEAAPNDEPQKLYPRAARVIGEKVSLRAFPHIDSALVTTVKRGAVLLSFEEKDDWLRVLSPLGKECWITTKFTEFEE